MNKILALLFIFILMACNDVHKSSKPDYLIEKSKMIDIMYDIKLISAARSKSYKKLKDSSVKTDLFIYHKYQIDSLTLRQNLDYYATNSFEEFKDMEQVIKLRFETEKKKLELEIQTQDSLSKKKNLNKDSFQSRKVNESLKKEKN